MEYIGNIIYDETLINSNEKYVIFGAGTYGKRILRYMDRNGVKDKVVCFCDSSGSLKGQEMDEIPIVYIKEAFDMYPDVTYLISGKYAREMYQIAKDNSIRKSHILFM